ncbi:MAG: hypothetical protein QHC65_18000 [Sphingomonas sp.]|nr:Lar family restriction alleviation protein [Sphingomonas sp.]MDX3886318.1 hypothetical protein [Sphingomonas sp.]
MTNETERLLPCPFCGSGDVDAHGWKSLSASGPACNDCGASAGEVAANHVVNVAAWNTRAQPVQSVHQLDGEEFAENAYCSDRPCPDGDVVERVARGNG